jgi:fructose-bisphosphate aldolase class 1
MAAKCSKNNERDKHTRFTHNMISEKTKAAKQSNKTVGETVGSKYLVKAPSWVRIVILSEGSDISYCWVEIW